MTKTVTEALKNATFQLCSDRFMGFILFDQLIEYAEHTGFDLETRDGWENLIKHILTIPHKIPSYTMVKQSNSNYTMYRSNIKVLIVIYQDGELCDIEYLNHRERCKFIQFASYLNRQGKLTGGKHISATTNLLELLIKETNN